MNGGVGGGERSRWGSIDGWGEGGEWGENISHGLGCGNAKPPPDVSLVRLIESWALFRKRSEEVVLMIAAGFGRPEKPTIVYQNIFSGIGK